MHCAKWVLSCLPPLFIEDRRTYICSPPLFMEERRDLYLSTTLWDTKQGHCLILWRLGHFTIQVFFKGFHIHNLETEKVLSRQHLLPDIAEKLTSSYSCRGWNAKNPQNISPRNKKVARFCRKSNQLQCVQRFGM